MVQNPWQWCGRPQAAVLFVWDCQGTVGVKILEEFKECEEAQIA